MKVICTKKCFYDCRLYEVGESTEVEGKKVPPHFIAEKEFKAAKGKKVDEPTTLYAVQKKQKKETTLE